MVFNLFLLLQVVCLGRSADAGMQKEPPAGIYVYKYIGKHPVTNQLIRLFPDDSLFCYGHYAIEKVVGIHDMAIGQTETRVEKLTGYYFIDLDKSRFFKMDSVMPATVPAKPVWENIDKKLYGLQMNFQYYHGEPFVTKDTLIQQQTYKLVRYTSQQQDQQKGAVTTVCLRKTTTGPSLFRNLESKFQGRVHTIFVTYPNNQGTVQISLEYQKMSHEYYMSGWMRKLVAGLSSFRSS